MSRMDCLIEWVECQQLFEHFRLTRLADFPGQKHLVHDRVYFVEVEHQIQLADVVEVFVENLHEVVNGFEITQVVIVHVDADAEVETSIATINNFEIAELKNSRLVSVFGAWMWSYLHKIGVLGVSDGDDRVDFLNQLLLLVIIEIHVPFRQSGFASPVLDQDKSNLEMFLRISIAWPWIWRLGYSFVLNSKSFLPFYNIFFLSQSKST